MMQVNLSAANDGQVVSGTVKESPLITRKDLIPHEAMHVKGRDDDQLIWLQKIHFIINAKVPGTADMKKEFIEIMAMIAVSRLIQGYAIITFIITTTVTH